MRDRLIFTGQLLFTLLVAAFLVVPAILSISAGVTVNYFRGIQLRRDPAMGGAGLGSLRRHHRAVVRDRTRTLVVTLVVGVPAAYALHVRGGRLARMIEEIITLPLAIPGPRDRSGAAADLWRFWLVSPLVALHSVRPCCLHHAIHGAFGDGGIRDRRHQDAGRRRGIAGRITGAALSAM